MCGTILIVDDVATNRIVLKVKLAAERYAVAQASTGREALAAVRGAAQGDRPDLVLLDVGLPDMDGVAVLRAMRSDPQTADIPVLMFTAAADRALRLRALAAGADGFLDKPFDDAVLLARIRSLLRDPARSARARAEARALGAIGLAEPAAGFAAQAHVALVAPRAETAMAWRRRLAPHLSDRISVLDRDEALATAGLPGAPDLYVIGDTGSAGRGSGHALLADLRARGGGREAAFCLILPTAGGDAAAIAFDLGAGDVLAEDFDGEEAAARLRVLLGRKRSADALRAAVRAGLEAAVHDPLTGLWNRRYAMPTLARMVEAAGRAGRRCAAMLVDIDQFKRINDGYGHAAGDAVLAGVARRLSGLAGTDALVARIGGEEFLVALPDATEATARAVADRIRAGVEAAPFALTEGVAASLKLTVSIGVAVSRREGDAADRLMAAADRALLVAKAEGRNQVTLGCTPA
jgi:two-component system cell cycle response regulator